MKTINNNGELVPESDLNIAFSNRSFRYGDGFFETIKLHDGIAQFYDFHYQRIRASLEILWMDKPGTMSHDTLLDDVNKTIEANGHRHGRIRIIFYRKGKGTYKPNKNDCAYYIEITKAGGKDYGSNKTGHKLGVYESYKKPICHLSRVKTNNALPFILAQAYCESEGFDDVVIMNTDNRVCEASSSSIFIVIQDQMFTPPVREGGIDSTSRHIITALAEKHHLPLMEENLSLESLQNADEIFTANAITGIQWISEFAGNKYKNKFSEGLLRYWNNALKTQE